MLLHLAEIFSILRKLCSLKTIKLLQPLKEGQAKLEQGLARLEAKLDQSIEEFAGFFHETWNKLDKIDEKLDDHETRIRQLEEDSEFPHSH